MATATKSQTNGQENGKSEQTRKPVFTSRHRRLQVAVWQNESSQGTFFTASIQRSYQDGDDWQRSSATLNRDDLLVAGKLLNWAHSAVANAIESQLEPPVAKRPVSSQRYRNLEAAVWRREGENGPFYTVSLKRSYQVSEEWCASTISLSNDDLLPMARLLERAFDAIDDLYAAGDVKMTEPAADESSNVNETPF